MDLNTAASNFGNPESDSSGNTASLQEYWKKQQETFKSISYVYGLHAKYFPFKFIGFRSGINTDGVVPIGVSINWKHINVFKKVQLDYDFGISTEQNTPDNMKFSHVVKLTFRVGPTREEATSESWYRNLVKEPQNDFNDAMRLYLAKKYWLASFAFGKVIAKWPSFSKVDLSTFYMGKCYEYMHMYDVARETYAKGLKKYTTSDIRPKFIFQIENLDYKTGSYDNAIKNYGFIMNLYRESDVSPDADYVAGQIYYTKNDFESAMNTLNSIDKGNENYLYAQYTLAMINVRRKNFDEATGHLMNILSTDSIKTVSEKALREMSFVKLGHIYFEQGDLKNAYGAYKQISPESRSYDEALLGLSWTLVRGGVEQSYQQAIKSADNLISARPKSFLLAEAYLVMGYAQTLLKDYDKAAASYKRVVELCDAKYLSREDLESRNNKNQTALSGYGDFQKKAISLALRKPTPTLEEQKLQMTTDWEKYDSEIRDYAVFKMEADAQMSFKKSAVKLKKDAEYALATTLHLMDSEKKGKIIDKTKQETQSIDKEMDDLKEQLKQLENKK